MQTAVVEGLFWGYEKHPFASHNLLVGAKLLGRKINGVWKCELASPSSFEVRICCCQVLCTNGNGLFIAESVFTSHRGKLQLHFQFKKKSHRLLWPFVAFSCSSKWNEFMRSAREKTSPITLSVCSAPVPLPSLQPCPALPLLASVLFYWHRFQSKHSSGSTAGCSSPGCPRSSCVPTRRNQAQFDYDIFNKSLQTSFNMFLDELQFVLA